MKRVAVVTSLFALALAAPAGAGSGSTHLLRLDGIGPLKLGMSRTAALKTGWLAHRATGCTLGGKPYPVAYSTSGRGAPSGLDGIAEFDRDRLVNLSFSRGARTATGVVVGRTTPRQMVRSYIAAHFLAAARFDDVFGGTFVTVRKRRFGRQVIGAFATSSVIGTLAIPTVLVCE